MTKEERLAKARELQEHMKEAERLLRREGFRFICGADEVGRGPLAGPVFTAAVVLPEDFDTLGINDSKKLSEKKREELYAEILEKALAVGRGSASHERIDEINILEATKEAMRAAILDADEKLRERVGSGIDMALLDALSLKDLPMPQRGIIKGDANVECIAAASIVAKVERDRLMVRLSEKYPEYSFEKNKGYGTAAHYAALAEFGPCEIHRKSFLH